jgi:hypothetical protein
VGKHVIITEEEATPLEYLERLLRMQDIFGMETRLEALIIQNGEMRIATSQPFVKGRAPSEKEIQRMMQDFDFRKSPHGQAFYRAADNMVVWDAHAGNFLVSESIVVPLDVICAPASPLIVKALGF